MKTVKLTFLKFLTLNCTFIFIIINLHKKSDLFLLGFSILSSVSGSGQYVNFSLYPLFSSALLYNCAALSKISLEDELFEILFEIAFGICFMIEGGWLLSAWI